MRKIHCENQLVILIHIITFIACFDPKKLSSDYDRLLIVAFHFR